MLTVLKYKKITIDYAIYIKVLYDRIVPYLTVSTYGVLNNIDNETDFSWTKKVLNNNFRLKFNMNMSLIHWIFGLWNILLVLVLKILMVE